MPCGNNLYMNCGIIAVASYGHNTEHIQWVTLLSTTQTLKRIIDKNET